MKIYFISGLGADRRVFEYLRLSQFQTKHIEWVVPEIDDSLESYSHKLIAQIDTAHEVVLVGVSFGGMICQEIAKVIRCKHVIIISSIKRIEELTWQLKFVRKTRIDKLFPSGLIKMLNLLTVKYYFNIQSKEEAKLVKAIVADTDRFFMKWAIDAIMKWENHNPYSGIIHIHGSKDRVFPPGKIKDYIQIKDGGHFMIVNKAKEIGDIIIRQIAN